MFVRFTLFVSLCIGCLTLAKAQPNTIDDLYDPKLYPFYHGVAAGDPLANGFIIWTRVTLKNASDSIPVTWEVARDPKMRRVVATGDTVAESSRDYTVKVDVSGLYPGTTYYYRFYTGNRRSLTGKARTAPTEAVHSLKFAVVSCSNYEWGYFSGYDKIAKRTDLDAVIHLGDYFYEYADNDSYSSPQIRDERVLFPSGETITLEDYRTRYSTYRLDPNLRKVHQQHAFITIWDDHESANDSWVGGAENHQNDEGDWEARKAVAKQAYFEWMPIRNNGDRIFRALSYGPLLDLIMIDTRLEGRDQQATNLFEAADPSRSLLGAEQKSWLKDQLLNSEAQWKVIGNQVIFSELTLGFAGPFQGTTFEAIESLFLDIWDGYRAERTELINFFRDNSIQDIVLLTGDFHSSFAFEVVDFPPTFPVDEPIWDPTSAIGSYAVEFATPSISAANFDENLDGGTSAFFESIINKPILPTGQIDPAGLNFNPHLAYVDLDQHGYFVLTVSELDVQADYYYLEDILVSETNEFWGAGVFSFTGTNDLNFAPFPSPPKKKQDKPAPLTPDPKIKRPWWWFDYD